MSKYSEKVERRRAAGEFFTPPATLAVVDEATKGEKEIVTAAPPFGLLPTPPKKKVATPPPEPRGQIGNLGTRPARLAEMLANAAKELKDAAVLAEEIYNMAKPGLQRAEPLSILQFCSSIGLRVAGMVDRAAHIRNSYKGPAT